MKKIMIAAVVVGSILAATSPLHAQSITLDHVDGLTSLGTIGTDTEIVFHIRMVAGPVGNKGITNGFRVYSPDGATWESTTIDTTGTIGHAEYDLIWDIFHFSADGAISDTVGLVGCVMLNPVGMPAGFDDITHNVTIGPIDAIHESKHICIDSCWWPPSGMWKWVDTNVDQIIPSWDGPHCFEIGSTCCALRGDIDHNGFGPNLADLVYLLNYMYNDGSAPPCLAEADIDGDGNGPDEDDLAILTSYITRRWVGEDPFPTPCPGQRSGYGNDMAN